MWTSLLAFTFIGFQRCHFSLFAFFVHAGHFLSRFLSCGSTWMHMHCGESNDHRRHTTAENELEGDWMESTLYSYLVLPLYQRVGRQLVWTKENNQRPSTRSTNAHSFVLFFFNSSNNRRTCSCKWTDSVLGVASFSANPRERCWSALVAIDAADAPRIPAQERLRLLWHWNVVGRADEQTHNMMRCKTMHTLTRCTLKSSIL